MDAETLQHIQLRHHLSNPGGNPSKSSTALELLSQQNSPQEKAGSFPATGSGSINLLPHPGSPHPRWEAVQLANVALQLTPFPPKGAPSDYLLL